jgi:hypothetical protein
MRESLFAALAGIIVLFFGVCSAMPIPDVNAKAEQPNIKISGIDKIISIFGEPAKYAWEEKTFERQNLPSTYMAVYPDGLCIVMSNDHITEIRFVKPFDSVKMLDNVIRLIQNDESLQTLSEKQNEQMQTILGQIRSLDSGLRVCQALQRDIETCNRQLERIQETKDSLRLVGEGPVTIFGESDPQKSGRFRTRYISKAFLRCERPMFLLRQETPDIQTESITIEAKRVMSRLQGEGFLEYVFRRDKVRETKWFKDNDFGSMDVSQFVSALNDNLTVKLTDTADIEVTFSATDTDDSKAILSEMLRVFVKQEKQIFDLECGKKLEVLTREENALRDKLRSIHSALADIVRQMGKDANFAPIK